MPSFFIEAKDSDSILSNKYGRFSKLELEQQLQGGFLTVQELSEVYGLSPFRMKHVLNSLAITYRTSVNDARVTPCGLTAQQHQVLLGTLLGDAYMKRPREFQLTHSVNQADYLYHISEIMSPYVSTLNYKEEKTWLKINMWTHNNEVFTPYFNRFYQKGIKKKFFDSKSIEGLSPEGLAYWYMDDGKYGEYGFYLCVGNIVESELGALTSYLIEKLDIKCNAQVHDKKMGYYNIYIKAESRSHFLELIEPYIIPSMRYKLDGSSYPKYCDKNFIIERHLQFCKKVNRPIRFSGDSEIERGISEGCDVKDPKEEYIDGLKAAIKDKKTLSSTNLRRLPSDVELVKLFGAGKTDQEIASGYGFGRNTIARERRRLGIARKSVRGHKIDYPCLRTRLVLSSKVTSNEYNPNVVCTPEMQLLIKSIEEDGVTQPVVTFYDPEKDLYVVIDGFHRYKVLKDHFKCDKIPVVVLEKDISSRMASTVRHNRARGKHQVDLMGILVNKLEKQGWSDEKIAVHLGMEGEELLRLRQQVGCAKMLANQEYSRSWEMAK